MKGRRELHTALVTGPTGAVGTALCGRLAARGIRVYAAVRPGTRRAEHLRAIPGVEVLECDASRLETLP